MAIRFFQGRAWRKLRRNRLAIVATGVIVAYVIVALLGFVGVINTESTQERVLADKTPGWLQPRDVDKRANDATWLAERIMDRIERAIEEPDPAGSERILDEVRLAERMLFTTDEEQLADASDRLDAQLAAMYDAFDLKDEAVDTELSNEERIKRFRDRDPERFADRIAKAEAEIAEARASIPELTRLAETEVEALEALLAEVMPYPSGLRGAAYTIRTCLGSDNQGRSIMMKSLFSVRIAFQIGFVVAIASVIIGTALGAAGAFYGRWIDYGVMYLVSVLSSVPSLVLLAVIVYIFFGSPLFDNPAERPGLALIPVYAAMGLTYWVGACRVIRGEVMKIKGLEYVQAATSIGFGRMYTLVKHVIPNTAHLMFINFALLFIGAIKSEVILSFLGLGVKGQPSWGRMISQGKDDVLTGFFWEVGAASVFMFGLVLAFNILTDALQDAFDPRHVD